jgi:YVTN family beta-propeller protein
MLSSTNFSFVCLFTLLLLIYTSTVLTTSSLIPSSKYHAFADHQERQIAIIDVGGSPRGIALDKRSNMMYIALYSADTVAKIDPNNNRVIHRIPAGDGPQDVAFNDANGMIYVSNHDDNTVSVIDPSTNPPTVTTTIQGNFSTPDGIAYNPDNHRIYVANRGSTTVTVIEGNNIVNVIELRNPLGAITQGPHEISFNPLDHKIYVTDHQDRYVSIIDETGMSTSPVVTHVQVEDRFLSGVSFSVANNKMYVASSVSETAPRGKVFVLENGAVVDQIDVGYHPRGIAYNPSSLQMYVTNFGGEPYSNTVSVIDINNAIVDTITVGIAPWDIAYNPTNSKMYLTNQIDGTVSVIGMPPAVCACP